MANPNLKPLLTKKQLKQLLDDGHSLNDIGKTVGVKRTTVGRWAKKYGLKPLPPGGKNIIDISGRRFGKLVVDALATNNGRAYWLCKCDCGNTKIINGSTLRRGITKSCGCISHGLMYKGSGLLSKSYWNRIVKGANLRNIELSITIDDAWKLYQEQNGLCALSGLPIILVTDFTNKHHLQTASLDRINNQEGYNIDNIHWIHKDINMMKGTLELKYLVYLCTRIYKNVGKIIE